MSRSTTAGDAAAAGGEPEAGAGVVRLRDLTKRYRRADGRIEQLGTPRDVYVRPASRYVANFVGLANEVPGTVSSVGGEYAVLDGPLGRATGVPAQGLAAGQEAVAVWRPEDALLSPDEPRADNRWRAEPGITMFAGPHREHRLSAGDLTWRVWSSGEADSGGVRDGGREPVWVTAPPARTRILPA
ncbi:MULTISPECIES: hypothetical protein [unclassified Spirillospora]|uniref:hypothetical protein n=1 Tax=unclassified Spirillospora TaxID=2642701 RepID=UPI003710EDF1